jgi:hypothetical protein
LCKNWKHIFFCNRKEKRGKKQETRSENQEARAKKREPRSESQEARGKKREARTKSREEIELFAVRFLCVSAPLRAKKRMKQETRAKKESQEPRAEKR